MECHRNYPLISQDLSSSRNPIATNSELLCLHRECVRAGAAGAQTRRSLGHHLLHPMILRPLVLCAPAVLRPRALQDAPTPADPKS